MMDFIFVGLIILFVFAIWDYKYALLPNLPVLISIIGYGVFLVIQPIYLLFYIFFVYSGGVLWYFYAKKHHMSFSDSILFGLFVFCTSFFNFYPLILFIIFVALFYKTSICCHYEKNQRLVKMIPPMFISLFIYSIIFLIT